MRNPVSSLCFFKFPLVPLRCGELGHNRRRCTARLPLISPVVASRSRAPNSPSAPDNVNNNAAGCGSDAGAADALPEYTGGLPNKRLEELVGGLCTS